MAKLNKYQNTFEQFIKWVRENYDETEFTTNQVQVAWDHETELYQAFEKWLNNRMKNKSLKKIGRDIVAETPFLQQIASALDSLTDGRGYGIEEDRICKLAEAAPELLEACNFALLCIAENWKDLSNVETQLKIAIAKANGTL